LSDTHCIELHVPPLQFRLQQSVGLTQLAPSVAQAGTVQMCMVGSHIPEQQSELVVHALPPVKQPPSEGAITADRSWPPSSPPSPLPPSMSPFVGW
jgi:hypothetical protein